MSLERQTRLSVNSIYSDSTVRMKGSLQAYRSMFIIGSYLNSCNDILLTVVQYTEQCSLQSNDALTYHDTKDVPVERQCA
jgi:hypothetical protein